jgi:DNA-binding NarL/FixJ family response regulator
VIRVLIVDDHSMLRAALRCRLEQEPDIVPVGESGTADDAVAKARRLTPDVVLLDLLLPKKNGSDVIADLARVSPESKILVLSSQAAPNSVRRALSAGAAGYVSKRCSDRELLTAIRDVADGKGYVESNLGAALVAPGGPSPFGPLSEREQDVLQLLALGYTNQEIGKQLFISVRTVDTHRAHIMLKLALTSRAELVMFALANGIVGTA